MKDRWNEVERQIRTSSTTNELRALRSEFHGTHDASLLGANDAAGFVEEINYFHNIFIRKTVSIAEERVRERFHSPPVSSFAILLFGSGGRGEQTLWSDQDNGLVYDVDEGADIEAADRYMAVMGEAIQECLEEVGYPPCEGKVLVSNPLWRKSLPQWKSTFLEWFEQPEFETVRHMLIMADARPIYGNELLAYALRDEFMSMVANRPNILPRMLQNTLRYKMLVGVFGNLITEPYGEDAGGIDIKYGAYIPMVNAIRLLALHHGISVPSTLGRIKSFESCSGIKPADACDWESAFRSVLALRSMTPFHLEDGTFTSRGILSEKMLTKAVKQELKQALRIGSELQKLVKRTFGREGYL